MWKIGDKAECKHCHDQIEYHGDFWVHTRTDPRHPGEPTGESILTPTKGELHDMKKTLYISQDTTKAAAISKQSVIGTYVFDLFVRMVGTESGEIYVLVEERVGLDQMLKHLGILFKTVAQTGIYIAEGD